MDGHQAGLPRFRQDYTRTDMSFAGNPGSRFEVTGFGVPRNVLQGLFGLSWRSAVGPLWTVEYHVL